jgi:hypothetical protein
MSKLPEDEKEFVHMLFYQKCPLKAYSDKKYIAYLRAVKIGIQVLRKLRCYLHFQLFFAFLLYVDKSYTISISI